MAGSPEEPSPGSASEGQYGEGEELGQVLLGTVAGDVRRALLQSALEAAGVPSRSEVGGDPFMGSGRTGAFAAASAPPRIYVNRRDPERVLEIWRAYEVGEEG